MERKKLRTDILVYLAGPYTSDPQGGTEAMVDAHVALLDAGIASVCPLYSHYAHIRHPRDYETWFALDLALLKRCDLLVRMRGISKGADREIDFAIDHNIPVLFLTQNSNIVREVSQAITGEGTQH